MLRFSKFFITLPLLALPLSGIASKAEAVSQLDALRLLAKSRAADGKCKILPAGEADELNGYLARAEIAAASRNSLSEVQSTIALGKTLGNTATCSDTTTNEVGATLSAARQAMAAVHQPRRGEEEETEVVENPTPRLKIRAPQEPLKVNVTLTGYGRDAFAYFVERRCEYLSRRDTRSFWRALMREHEAALSKHGKPAVARTLRRARIQAEEIECDGAGRQLVRSAYTKLARN